VTLLAGSQDQDLVARLENKLGSKVQYLEYAGPVNENAVISDDDLAKLINDIESSPLAKVMLVVQEGKITVLPYQEK
jgi:hypothetical protein